MATEKVTCALCGAGLPPGTFLLVFLFVEGDGRTKPWECQRCRGRVWWAGRRASNAAEEACRARIKAEAAERAAQEAIDTPQDLERRRA